MFGYSASNASRVAWRASPSAPVDCQPDRTTVPVTLWGSQAVDGAAIEPSTDGLAPPGLSAPVVGDWVAPLLQAPKMRIAVARPATARKG
jgi:hypothetical protein